MARPRNARTPESRSAQLQEQASRVRRRYKVNINKRKKFTFEGESELVKNMTIVLKLAGYTNTQIATIVGVSRGQVKEILSDGNVQKQLVALANRLPQAALDLGRAYLIEAVQSIAHVMRTSTDEAMVLKAVGELFDRFGLPKVSRNEQKQPEVEIGDHPVTQTMMERLRSASPEVQAKVADLQQMFEEGVSEILSTTSEEKDGITPSEE